MDQRRNEGISMSGGRIDAGALAVGRHARATNVVEAAGQTLTERGQAEVAGRLADLVRQLEEHASRLDNADELRETTEAVATELAKDRPNRITVTSLLDGLAKGVGSVASLTTAVQALAQAAIAIL